MKKCAHEKSMKMNTQSSFLVTCLLNEKNLNWWRIDVIDIERNVLMCAYEKRMKMKTQSLLLVTWLLNKKNLNWWGISVIDIERDVLILLK